MNHSAMVDFVHALEPSIAEHLGTEDLDDAREFALQCLYVIEGNAKLFMASKQSLAASILTAAKMRLVPSLGLGKIAAQWLDGCVQALFSPSWRGWLQLLHDHCGVVDATAEAVFSRDRFFCKRLPDSRDAIEFEPCTVGPRGDLLGVFVRLVIETKSGGRLTHVETVWRSGDLDPVTPDGSEGPGFTRNHHDHVEFAKTVALKRAAKWCAARGTKGAVLIAAAIELERGSERSSVVPSAVRVARMLGIDVPEFGSPPPSPPVVVEDRPPEPKTPEPPRALVERGLVVYEQFTGVCCECRKAGQVRRSPAFVPSKECPKACSAYTGGDHTPCAACQRKQIKAAGKKNNEARSPERGGVEFADAASKPGPEVEGAPPKRDPVPLAPSSGPNTTPSEVFSEGTVATDYKPEAAVRSDLARECETVAAASPKDPTPTIARGVDIKGALKEWEASSR